MRKLLAFVFGSALLAPLAAAGCSSSTTPSSGSDAGASDATADVPDAPKSKCGKPGDLGNEIGVGKYCKGFGDCTDTKDAHICSILGDSETFFCTRLCPSPDAGGDAGPSPCGTGASCTCSDSGCGCTPTVCL